MKRLRQILTLSLVLMTLPLLANEDPPTPAGALPPGLENVGFDQNLGRQVDLDLEFTDSTGKKVRLGDYFGDKPVVLSLV